MELHELLEAGKRSNLGSVKQSGLRVQLSLLFGFSVI